MQVYKADLHIHSVLSPCGDLEMSPSHIICKAKEKGLDIIGLTDHNSTLQAELTAQIGGREGIWVICGTEVCTMEEIHCLAYFEKTEELRSFQDYLEKHLPFFQNNTDRFGFQLIVDENEDILAEVEPLLINALDVGIEEIYDEVKKRNGVFIPAHIDKKANSLMSQLGFVPPDIRADALEITKFTKKDAFLKKAAYLKKFSFIQSSDAHLPDLIGEIYCLFHMESLNFHEFLKALHQEEGRYIELLNN